eukprot:05826.XXX_84430_83861_1 [CDS] Oithona nana genome sequencing.
MEGSEEEGVNNENNLVEASVQFTLKEAKECDEKCETKSNSSQISVPEQNSDGSDFEQELWDHPSIQATSSSEDISPTPSIDLEHEENWDNRKFDKRKTNESELSALSALPKITAVYSYVTSKAKSDITAITDPQQNLRLNPFFRKRKRIMKAKRDFGNDQPKRQYEPYI